MHINILKVRLLFTLITLFAISTSCSQTENIKTQIAWDTWGVPHITSATIEDLFYAQGWAQMHNHANLILELYGSSRGKGAEYWGQSKLQNDMLIHTLGFEELAKEWETKQDPEIKTIYTSFIKGMNAYAKAHPDAIDQKNKVVLPLTAQDMNMHSIILPIFKTAT